jgi:BolA protein
MNIEASIKETLQQTLAPRYLSVENESHMHNVPAGSESHFKVVLVSDEFDGKPKVARHRMVYQQLAGFLADGVHALALHTYTSAEWQTRNERAPISPDCMGGSSKNP